MVGRGQVWSTGFVIEEEGGAELAFTLVGSIGGAELASLLAGTMGGRELARLPADLGSKHREELGSLPVDTGGGAELAPLMMAQSTAELVGKAERVQNFGNKKERQLFGAGKEEGGRRCSKTRKNFRMGCGVGKEVCF